MRKNGVREELARNRRQAALAGIAWGKPFNDVAAPKREHNRFSCKRDFTEYGLPSAIMVVDITKEVSQADHTPCAPYYYT